MHKARNACRMCRSNHRLCPSNIASNKACFVRRIHNARHMDDGVCPLRQLQQRVRLVKRTRHPCYARTGGLGTAREGADLVACCQRLGKQSCPDKTCRARHGDGLIAHSKTIWSR